MLCCTQNGDNEIHKVSRLRNFYGTSMRNFSINFQGKSFHNFFSIILNPWWFLFHFRSLYSIAFVAISLCVIYGFPLSRTFQADKILISLPIRHLLYQKFQIILNIVLIVNEFECCVSCFFPQHRFSAESKSCACSGVGFLQFSQKQHEKEISTKDTWSSEIQLGREDRRKNQLCVVQWMNGKTTK